MAKVIGGPFGLLSGKLGNRVYYIVDGKQMSRALGKRMKPPTVKELANRQGMKVAFEFAKTVGVFIDIGFGIEAKERDIQPRNAAVGCIRKEALKGGYPDIEIDYAKLLLSRGSLPGLTAPSVSLAGRLVPQETSGPGEVLAETLGDGIGAGAGPGSSIALRYCWTVEPQDLDWPRCNDQVMLMAYCPELEEGDKRACYKLSSARRGTGEDVLLLPQAFGGRSVEVYISAVADDRNGIADSQYLGKIDWQ